MDPIPEFNSFGARLKWWREKRGFAHQGKFADQVGIKQGSLSELEGGKSKEPAAKVLLKLCDLLQLRPKYLLLGEGTPDPQYFEELSGPEGQLVMMYRALPTDALRQSLRIYADDMVSRAKAERREPALANPNPRVTKHKREVLKT